MIVEIIISFIYILLFPIIKCEDHTCISIVTPDYQACTHGEFHILSHTACRNEIHMCKRGFNISLVRVEPLSSRYFKDIVREVISHCCGNCSNVPIINQWHSMIEVSRDAIKTSHIVYPVLGRVDATKLYGMYFLPFWDAPGAYYVTRQRTKEMIVRHLLMCCLQLWPLLVCMIIMAIIAGFVVWLGETWVNQEMFSRGFLPGVFDGFWWSFVTMTTVGYGDKTPKFVTSRLFSIIWIIIGITICSMFTATLTTEVNSALSPVTPKLHGAKVGVLKQHLYDSALVAKHGGTIVETRGVDLLSDVIEMIRMLQKNKISGFLLNKFAYYEAKSYCMKKRSSNYSDYEDFFLNSTQQTEVGYGEDMLAFGALIREKEDYYFLREFMLDNRLSMETCTTLWSNAMHEIVHHENIHGHIEHNMFSPESGFFIPTIVATCSVLGVILVFGVLYEMVRSSNKSPTQRTNLHEVFSNGSTNGSTSTRKLPRGSTGGSIKRMNGMESKRKTV